MKLEYSDEDIRSCVDAGIVTEAQWQHMQSHLRERKNQVTGETEKFRLLSGLNDIFVVVACALVLAALGSFVSNMTGLHASLGVLVGAWALAEYFVRIRKMALPGVVLALTFGLAGIIFAMQNFGFEGVRLVGICLAAGALQVVFWLRFRVPISVAAATACLVLAIQILVTGFSYELLGAIPLVQLASGVSVFAFAMWWDARDLERTSYRADIAFWLHILAAPMIVAGTFGFLDFNRVDGDVTAVQALIITALYLLLAIVSLWVDRRALMLAALGVLVYSYSQLLANYGVASLNFAITALVVGGGLLVLSVYWQRCREWALRCVPGSLQRMVPPLEAPAADNSNASRGA